MSRDEIEQMIIEALQEVQEISGRECGEIRPELKPVGKLPGFDSQSGIEATILVEEKVGRDLGLDSIFVSEDGKRALSVREVAERVSRILSDTKERLR